jgi:hypothetical protein
MKSYKKTIIVLIIYSLICVYVIVDLLSYTFFQEKSMIINTLDYSVQFQLVNIFGITLFASILMVLFSNGSKNNFN